MCSRKRCATTAINHPTYEGSFCATPTRSGDRCGAPPFRRIPTDRPIGAGELVAMHGQRALRRVRRRRRPHARVLRSGRTCERRAARAGAAVRAPRSDAVVAECTPGTRPSDLLAVWTRSGEPLPPVADRVRHRARRRSADRRRPRGAPRRLPLAAGMVLVVQGYVWEPGVGGYFGADTVHVTARRPRDGSRSSLTRRFDAQ